MAENKSKPAEEPKKEETVSISKTQLTEILKKLEKLESVADKGRLELYDNQNKPKDLTRVRLNVYEDRVNGKTKVIMAWKMIIDEASYDSYRGYFEKQVIELTLEDDSKIDLPYVDFSIGKKRKQEVAEIVSRSKNEQTNSEIFEVRRLSDGKEFKVDSRFIN